MPQIFPNKIKNIQVGDAYTGNDAPNAGASPANPTETLDYFHTGSWMYETVVVPNNRRGIANTIGRRAEKEGMTFNFVYLADSDSIGAWITKARAAIGDNKSFGLHLEWDDPADSNAFSFAGNIVVQNIGLASEFEGNSGQTTVTVVTVDDKWNLLVDTG